VIGLAFYSISADVLTFIMKATAEIQVIPIGAGVSVRREVKRAYELLCESGLKVELHASGTRFYEESTFLLSRQDRLRVLLYACLNG